MNDATETRNFDSSLMRSNHKGKVFSLLPFLVEGAFSPKSYVLRLELFPQAKYLRFHVLKFDGVTRLHVPIDQVIPITKYDYWGASWRMWFKQNQCLDLDMIYANKTSKEMYVFDKSGEWHDDGVYHEALDMENTFKETDWYDEFSVHNF